MASRLIADDIIADGAMPCLLGGRDRTTGRIVFPRPMGSAGADFDVVELAREGTLWSWTVQRFRPKSPPYAGPEAFAPYAVGYVELAEQVIVESRIEGIAFDDLRIGMPLAFQLVPFATDLDGTTVMTFAFGPAHQETAA